MTADVSYVVVIPRQFLAERELIDEAVRKIQLENEVATLQVKLSGKLLSLSQPVFRIRTHRIRKFLDHPDP
jgi:hypothetical protein